MHRNGASQHGPQYAHIFRSHLARVFGLCLVKSAVLQMSKRCRGHGCNQTASAWCQYQLCVRCCNPVCDPNNHRPRWSTRGGVGQNNQARSHTIWREARKLVDRHLATQRANQARKRAQLSWYEAMTVCCRSLRYLWRNPNADLDDDNVDHIFVKTLPPAVINKLVDDLRAKWPSDVPVEVEEDTSWYDAAGSSWDHWAWSDQSDWWSWWSSDWWSSSTDWCEPETLPSESRAETLPSVSRAETLPSVSRAEAIPALPLWRPEQKAPTRADGTPCAHYERAHPLTFDLAAPGTGISCEYSSEEVDRAAAAILSSWLQHRSLTLGDALAGELDCVCYPWDIGGRQDVAFHDVGRWFYLPFRRWYPAAPPGLDARTMMTPYGELEEMVHSSSMYTFVKTVQHGLLPGAEKGRGEVIAVYAFRRSGPKIATSSSGYSLYSDLAGNGIYFSPRWQMRVAMYMSTWPHIGAMSVGGSQIACKPGTYCTTGVYFHAVTKAEVVKAREGNLWFLADEWLPAYEM